MSFTALIDREHAITRLYQMVNVPMGVWIDEKGRIVRPPEVAYSRQMKVLGTTFGDDRYVDALRDWVAQGGGSASIMPEDRLAAHLAPASAGRRRADAEFRLALYLHDHGVEKAARLHWQRAQDLAPDNWNYHRQEWSFDRRSAGGKWMRKYQQSKQPYYAPIDWTKPSPPPGAGEWVSLFDGKSLQGWTQRNGTATYRIEGDSIVGQTTPGSPNSFLCTDKVYGDFEMTFEVKVDDRLNSGVQIRSRTRGGPRGRVNGPQVEIEASGRGGAEAGYVYGEAAGGWMTPKDKLVPHKHFKDGEWNAFRILARGPDISVWINGVPISYLTDEKKFESHPKGFIGLQVHGVGRRVDRRAGPFEVRWRKLRLREIGR